MHYINFIIMVYHIYLFLFEYFNSVVGMLERRQNGRRQWQPERFGVFTHLNPESGPCDLNVSPHHSCLLGPAALLNLLSLHQESTFKIIKMICHLLMLKNIYEDDLKIKDFILWVG